MSSNEFFIQRPNIDPTIYVYRLEGVASHEGYIKVGYTERDVETRIKEQIGASHVPYTLLYTESAMCDDGSCFMDHDVHAILERKGFKRLDIENDNEWYNCKVSDVEVAIREIKSGIRLEGERTQSFKMRPEQYNAVKRTAEYFEFAKKDEPDCAPKFLWNAKMRFGKTFASYQLVKKMGFKRVLVLTFKPAVESAWREDLLSHVDFGGWQFVSNKDAHNNNINIDQQFDATDKNQPIVVFGSFQDLLGTNEFGGIKIKNEFIHLEEWDLVIFDEYHFGAWRENSKKLFENPDDETDADFDIEKYSLEEAGNTVDYMAVERQTARLVTIQERFREMKYSRYSDFTVRYMRPENEHEERRLSEYFKLDADYFIYGIIDESKVNYTNARGFLKYAVLDLVALKNKLMPVLF